MALSLLIASCWPGHSHMATSSCREIRAATYPASAWEFSYGRRRGWTRGIRSISGTGVEGRNDCCSHRILLSRPELLNDLLLSLSLPGQSWGAVRACSYGKGETPPPRGPIGYSPSDARMQRLPVERYMFVRVRVYLWAWVHACVYLYMSVSVCPCT